MQRTYVRGDFRTVLEPALFVRIEALRKSDALAPIVVVVPSSLLVVHLRRRLAVRAAHAGVRFVTLDSLADELTLEVRGERGLTRQSALGERLLVASVARLASPDSWFHSVAAMPGFAERLQATIRDVADSGLTAADLRAIDERKIQDLAALMAEVERRRAAAGVLDSAAVLRLATKQAATHPSLAGVDVFVYGFYDFVGAQQRFVEAVLARNGGVVLTPIPDPPAGRFGQPLLDRLLQLGFEDGSPTPSPATCGSDLELLRSKLFRRARGESSGRDGSVRFLASRFRGDEPRDVLRVVRDLLGERIELHEIGILHRQRDAATSLGHEVRRLARVLATGIPVHLVGGHALAERPDAKALRLLLAALASDLDRRAVFAFLDSIGSEPRAPAFERIARRIGIDRGAAEWRRRLEDRESLLSRDLACGNAPHEDEEEGVPSPKRRARELADVRALRELAEVLQTQSAELFAAKSFTTAATALRAAFESHRCDATPLDGVFAELAALDSLDFGFDPESFRTLLELALESEGERTDPFEKGLFIGGLLASRGLSFRAVILPGLEEGVFPRRAAQDALLLDEERMRISKRLLPPHEPGLSLRARAADEERLLFHLACRSAVERLVMACPRFEDGSDQEIVPSSALRDGVEALLGKALPESSLWLEPSIQPLVSFGGSPIDLEDWDRENVRLAALAGDGARARALTEIDPVAAVALRAEQRRGSARGFTELDGVIPPDDARPLVEEFRRHPVAPTRLERYARCPFTFFASALLAVDETDPREEGDLDFRGRGQLVHRVAEHFFRGLIDRREPWPLDPARRGSLRRELLEMGGRHLEALCRETYLHPVVASAEKLRLEDELTALLDYEIDERRPHRPLDVEVTFGDSDRDALRLDCAGDAVRLTGKMDRIDVDEASGQAIVVDYKTSAKAPKSVAGLDGGRRLQLPLYALAADRRLPPGIRVAAAEYFYCSRRAGGERPSIGRDEFEGEGRLRLEKTIGGLLQGMRDGVFFADPTDENTCSRCGYALACGLGPMLLRRFEIKRSDPGAGTSELLALRQGDSPAEPRDESPDAAEDSE